MPVASRTPSPLDLLTGLGPTSQASLNAALQMWATPGVVATFACQIPLSLTRVPDWAIFTGPTVMSVDMWKMVAKK
jgi:hypothetical protein